MKYLIYILIILSGTSCNNGEHKEHSSKTGDYYTCSMHPEIVRDQPGQCPVCGMDLVKKSNVETQNVFTCPMHPEIIRDKPGQCPICGMDLVEKQSEGAIISDTTLQYLLKPTNTYVLSKIKTIRPIEKSVPIEINAVGIISYDTRELNTVSARVEGRIEKLYVKSRFQPISKGQKIMDIYSKELITEQENYLFLLNNEAENTPMINAAETKLSLMGLSKEQINSIRKTGKTFSSITIYSPFNGHLHDIQPSSQESEMKMSGDQNQELSIHEGMYVQKGQTVFNIYNTAKVWGLLDVYPEGQGLLKQGQKVYMLIDGIQDSISAKVDFIEPQLKEDKKSITIRVYLENADSKIKIGANIKGAIVLQNREGLFLPSKAVLSLGLDNIVFVMNDELLETRKVVPGLKTDSWVEILSGLNKNELVAENAQLLVDSEAFIKTKSK